MKYRLLPALILILTGMSAVGIVNGNEKTTFAPNVNMETGAINVPKDYTRWPTLGTWAHSNTKADDKNVIQPGSNEYHVVYTQPETIDYYQKHRAFPDGTVLVKELLHAETMQMTTGPAVSHATKIKGWFVLVRDTQGRFKDSKLWGDGWGWSLFNADDPLKTVSTDYQTDCLACHVPARPLARDDAVDADKWIYTLGYPVLKDK
ncbi:MAG: cytochrome P460 family protein [Nitrospinales bacterium]